MTRFHVPEWVQQCNDERLTDFRKLPNSFFDQLRHQLTRFEQPEPLVSIVIPAYNEERDLLKTLASLAAYQSPYPTELIVVNNNSTDETQALIEKCGVKTVFEPLQGISHARQAGLEAARGTYILNADADSIYPQQWGMDYVKVLENEPYVACVYGRYSFIPSSGTSRWGLGLHELVAEQLFRTRRAELEAINVMGFNFAYRRADALTVGGFKHNLNRAVTQRSEDGWMAFELYHQVGKIKLVSSNANRVWTSDRRLMADGNLLTAFVRRVRKYAPTLNRS